MNDPDAVQPRRPSMRRLIFAILVAAPAGAVVGYLVGGAAVSSIAGTDASGWSLAELASAVIATLLIVSAAYVALAASSDARWNAMVERQPAAEPVDPAARLAGGRQALVVALAGVLMLAPPFASHAGLALDLRAGIAALIAVLLAAQTWINLTLWRDGDELTRSVIATTGSACFWILQIALFGWAMLAKLGLVADVDSWTLFTVMMGTYLVVSTMVARRRGLVAG